MKKKILIVGGATGVGLELARQYLVDGHTVFVTGAIDPDLSGATFLKLSITQNAEALAKDIDQVLDQLPLVNTLIYAQHDTPSGQIETLADCDLAQLVNVGLMAPMMLVQRLKRRTQTTLKLMLITSEAEHEPTALAPVTCALASGLAMLGASLVRDPELGKVLVVAAKGIAAPDRDLATDNTTASLLSWSATQIIELSGGPFKYKYARTLTNPRRAVVIDSH